MSEQGIIIDFNKVTISNTIKVERTPEFLKFLDDWTNACNKIRERRKIISKLINFVKRKNISQKRD